MSVRSALMAIKVPGTEKPLFLMIITNREGECEGLLPTGRVREAEAEKVPHHIASSVMYRMMFEVLVDPRDIADFIKCRFSIEHAKVAVEYSSYVVQTRTVTLYTSSGLSNVDDDMRDLEEDWIDMSILENTAVLEIGNMGSGVIFDHDNDENSMSSVTTAVFSRNNMPAGAVSGLPAETPTVEETQTNATDAAATLGRGAADTTSASAGGSSHTLPPTPPQADVVGDNP